MIASAYCVVNFNSLKCPACILQIAIKKQLRQNHQLPLKAPQLWVRRAQRDGADPPASCPSLGHTLKQVIRRAYNSTIG